MYDSLLSILALLSIGLAAYGLGRPLLRGLAVGQEDRFTAAVFSVTLGLVAWGTLLAVIGLLGLLYREVIVGLTFAGVAWGFREVFAEADCAAARLGHQAQWPAPPGWCVGLLIAAAVLAASGSAVAALAPPTAGDALCYHLALPRIFLREQALVYLPYADNSTFPLLVEMCYLWALALDGGVAAQLVHWGMGVLLAMGCTVLAAPIVGKPWARAAGCLVLLVPGVTNQMTAALNDVGLALFATLSLAAWWKAAVDDENPRWYLLAGLLLGGALGTKYLAIIFAVAMLAAGGWLWWSWPARRRQLATGAAAMAVVAVSVAGLWYLRAAWHRGNPVYPFFHAQFGGEAPPKLVDTKAPLGRNLLALPTAAWHVTMSPERFGGRGHQVGALFLATLPGLLVCRRLRGLGLLLVIALVYSACWFVLRQNVRFLLPLVPLAGVAVVWVWNEAGRLPRVPRLVMGIATALLLGVGAAAAVARSQGAWAVAAGVESRHAYLVDAEPSYRAAHYANCMLNADAHILSQEHRTFYFQARVTRESIYRRRTAYDRPVGNAAPLVDRLREAGFTHLLLAEAENEAGIQYNETLSRLVESHRHETACLNEYRFTDADGAIRRYRLMSLR